MQLVSFSSGEYQKKARIIKEHEALTSTKDLVFVKVGDEVSVVGPSLCPDYYRTVELNDGTLCLVPIENMEFLNFSTGDVSISGKMVCPGSIITVATEDPKTFVKYKVIDTSIETVTIAKLLPDGSIDPTQKSNPCVVMLIPELAEIMVDVVSFSDSRNIDPDKYYTVNKERHSAIFRELPYTTEAEISGHKVADYLIVIKGSELIKEGIVNFSSENSSIDRSSVQSYAETLAHEIYGDKYDQKLVVGAVEKAITLSNGDMSKAMGIVKEIYTSKKDSEF